MNQKSVLILAASITAFILVAGGAIIGKAAQPDAAATLTPDMTEIQDLYAQREAEYQARLDEANAALAAVYAQQDAALAGSNPTQFDVSAPTMATLSTRDAVLIAAINVPNAQIVRIPELVDYQGTVAYEVTFDLGLMYIDANTGAVLYNGITQPQVSTQSGFHEDDDHGWDDD